MWEFIGKNGFYYKLNANCKESEKSGSGPGSCGGKYQTKEINGLVILPAKKISMSNVNERLQEAISNSGMKIYFPPGKQSRATGLYNQLNNLPPLLKSISSKYTFVFSANPNKENNIYGNTYGSYDPTFIGFHSSAANDPIKKVIISFDNRAFKFDDLLHELGHALSFSKISLGKNNKSLSESKEYINAVEQDNNYVSNYAKVASENSYDTDSLKEDFADSIKEYSLNPKKFQVDYPNRFKYFESLVL